MDFLTILVTNTACREMVKVCCSSAEKLQDIFSLAGMDMLGEVSVNGKVCNPHRTLAECGISKLALPDLGGADAWVVSYEKQEVPAIC